MFWFHPQIMNLILSPYFKLWVPFNLKFLLISFQDLFLLFFFETFPSPLSPSEERQRSTKIQTAIIKKSHTKNIYCFFDWFMYIKTYFVEKKFRREILHTDTCDLPLFSLHSAPTARKPRHLYLESWEFISYLLSGVCLFSLTWANAIGM